MPWFNAPWLVSWKTTAWNKYGEEMEQKRAMEYRHRTFDDWMRPTEWASGHHPIAQGLRDSGKTETPGFSANQKVGG
jgi:hypothetical protein